MQIRKRYIFIGLICVIALWLLQNKAMDWSDRKHNTRTLQQLKAVKNLPVWHQDILLNDLDSSDKAYDFLSDAIVSGKIGYSIDLADSIHTIIDYRSDTVIISSPLRIANINYEPGTLLLIDDASHNQTMNLTKAEIFRYLDHKALEQYLPLLNEDMKGNPLLVANQKLSDLTGKPVKIKLTQMPKITDWN